MSYARFARWLAVRLGPALVLALLTVPSSAAAQATSWLYVGGGAGILETGAVEPEKETRSALSLDTGLGTSAEHPVVVGGIFRVQAYFGAGADLGVAARIVTRGFAIGGFGAGIDAGVYQRWWGTESTGFTGNLVLGAPWGITLLGGASVGSEDQRIYFASLGIDLARLTVHRHSGLDWFANPMRSPGE
jgi:hypothetical protein